MCASRSLTPSPLWQSRKKPETCHIPDGNGEGCVGWVGISKIWKKQSRDGPQMIVTKLYLMLLNSNLLFQQQTMAPLRLAANHRVQDHLFNNHAHPLQTKDFPGGGICDMVAPEIGLCPIFFELRIISTCMFERYSRSTSHILLGANCQCQHLLNPTHRKKKT